MRSLEDQANQCNMNRRNSQSKARRASPYYIGSMKPIVLILMLLCACLQLVAQTRLQETTGKLDSLEQAMDQLRQRVTQLDSDAARQRADLNQLQQRLSANQQLMQQLAHEQLLLTQRTGEQENLLAETANRLESLERREERSRDAQFSLRTETATIVRDLYAQRHNDPLYWLLSAPSAKDALRRARLFPWFLKGLRRRLNSLDSLQTEIHDLQNRALAERALQERTLAALARSRSANERSRNESHERAADLANARAAVDRELSSLLADRKRAEARSAELSAAGERVAMLLQELRDTWEAREEQRRQEDQRLSDIDQRLSGSRSSTAGSGQRTNSATPTAEIQSGSGLATLRGKLGRPVEGRLSQAWGMVRNNTLGTTTDNPGTDYACTPGAPVSAVAAGEVARITWIPGYGNTLLLNHGKGYYTVYAKLESVQVAEGQKVQSGSSLGRAGTFDRPGEGSLHFELWQDGQHRNPEDWFAR